MVEKKTAMRIFRLSVFSTLPLLLPFGAFCSIEKAHAVRKGSLYVAEVNKISRYDDIDNKLDNPLSYDEKAAAKDGTKSGGTLAVLKSAYPTN
jgi:hypothetical protein